MKKHVLLLLLTALIAETTYAQFTGCYAAANWTVNNANTNGSLYAATNYFDIICDTDGSGNGSAGVDCSTSNNGNVSVCITVPASGTIQFNWTWTGGNNATLLTEPFGYCLNSVATDLTNNTSYTGTASVPVSQGDNFCFVLSSQFSNSHPTLFTHININQFSGPCTLTSVSGISLHEKNITASFSGSMLSVKGTSATGTVAVLDVAGKEVTRQRAGNSETLISAEIFPAGVYVIQYSDGNNKSFVRVVKI
jgi:hypothetical protein